jgi:hypothetical protein
MHIGELGFEEGTWMEVAQDHAQLNINCCMVIILEREFLRFCNSPR